MKAIEIIISLGRQAYRWNVFDETVETDSAEIGMIARGQKLIGNIVRVFGNEGNNPRSKNQIKKFEIILNNVVE